MPDDRAPSSRRLAAGKPLRDEAARSAVLLVEDDEPALQTVAAVVAADDQFDVLLSRSGRQALELLERSPVDVLCTDYRMPGMNGIELIRAVLSIWPEISTVLVTGFREYVSRETQGLPNTTVVFKPYHPRDLLAAIRWGATACRLRRSTSRLAAALGAPVRPKEP